MLRVLAVAVAALVAWVVYGHVDSYIAPVVAGVLFVFLAAALVAIAGQRSSIEQPKVAPVAEQPPPLPEAFNAPLPAMDARNDPTIAAAAAAALAVLRPISRTQADFAPFATPTTIDIDDEVAPTTAIEPSAAAATVMHGRDGVLFLHGDVNQVRLQLEGKFPIAPGFWDQTAALHAARQKTCGDHGAWYVHAVAPNKETALERFLPADILPRSDGPTPIELYQASGAQVFFKPDILRDPSETRAYYVHDSRWSTYGASLYLANLLQDFGAGGVAKKALAEMARSEIYRKGDLGAKVGLKGESVLEISNPRKKRWLAYANNVRNNGSARYFVNPKARAKLRVLILHDGAGDAMNDFASMALRETLFLQTFHFDPDFVAEHAFDGVIFLQTERLLVSKAPKQETYRGMCDGAEMQQKGVKTFDALAKLLNESKSQDDASAASTPA